MLLARHRKSVFGKNFFGELPAEVLSSYRSNMFLEVLISLCLYCMRGYFPNLMMSRLTDDELLGNNLVHIQAAEVCTKKKQKKKKTNLYQSQRKIHTVSSREGPRASV